MYMLGITIVFLPICPQCPGRAIPKGKLQKHLAVETAGDDGQFLRGEHTAARRYATTNAFAYRKICAKCGFFVLDDDCFKVQMDTRKFSMKRLGPSWMLRIPSKATSAPGAQDLTNELLSKVSKFQVAN